MRPKITQGFILNRTPDSNKTMTFRIILLIAALTVLPWGSSAEPFNRKRLPADTKWLVHLDVEGLLGTRVGKFLIRTVEQEMQGEIEKLQTGLSPDIAITTNSVLSISAFGSGYELSPESGGVLVLSINGRLKEVATGLLIQQALAGADDDKAPIREVENEGFPLYSIQGEVYVSLNNRNHVFLSKSLDEMQEARDIWAGKAPGMDATSSFGNLSELRESFFFLAVAEEFSRRLPIPPQANFLKLADSTRIVVGESEEDLYAELKLKTPDQKGATQVQQILQGLLAIAPLLAPNDPSVQKLLNRSGITNENQTISLSLRYPVDEAIKTLKEVVKKAKARPTRKGKKKH